MINPSVFKAYDIRGIYPTDLDEEGFAMIVKGVYSFYLRNMQKSSLRVVLGRDMRLSSPSFHDVAINALTGLGAQVLDIGMAASPTVYFALQHLKADISITITASHNPKEYNGMKFVKRVENRIEKPSGAYGVADIKQIVLSKDFAPEVSGGSVEVIESIADQEVEHFLSVLPTTPKKRYRIVADTANAMGASYLEALSKKIDIELIRMNFAFDGSFPAHQADPSQSATLTQLRKRVVEEQADFGVATDGDGDRIMFIDEMGNVVPSSQIASVIAKQLLVEHPGSLIIGNVMKIFTIKRNVERFGGTFDQERVGHTFITNRINTSEALFCGEISGHFFFKSNAGAESSILVFLHLIHALNEAKGSFSQMLAEFKQAAEKEETNFVVNSKETIAAILDELKRKYAGEKIETIDGVTVLTDSWRVNIRTSNTEPLLRLNVEANTEELVVEKFEEMVSFIESFGGKLKTGH